MYVYFSQNEMDIYFERISGKRTQCCLENMQLAAVWFN